MTCIFNFKNSGSLYDLKAVLGHADIKTTERYAHLSSSHLLGVRDIIQPNIGQKAEVISVNAFPRNPDATHPPQKSERGQDFSMSVNG